MTNKSYLIFAIKNKWKRLCILKSYNFLIVFYYYFRYISTCIFKAKNAELDWWNTFMTRTNKKIRGTSSKTVAQVKVVLESSRNHIKIAAKLEHNQHAGPPEIWLNGSPATKNLKKKPHWDWREGHRNREQAGPTPKCGR